MFGCQIKTFLGDTIKTIPYLRVYLRFDILDIFGFFPCKLPEIDISLIISEPRIVVLLRGVFFCVILLNHSHSALQALSAGFLSLSIIIYQVLESLSLSLSLRPLFLLTLLCTSLPCYMKAICKTMDVEYFTLWSIYYIKSTGKVYSKNIDFIILDIFNRLKYSL